MTGPDWRVSAACLDTDPEQFFPTPAAHTPTGRLAVHVAKRVCRECPSRQPCLEWAIDALPYGIAGGLTADERRNLRRRRERQARRSEEAQLRDTAAAVGTETAGRDALRDGWPPARIALVLGVLENLVWEWSRELRKAGAR